MTARAARAARAIARGRAIEVVAIAHHAAASAAEVTAAIERVDPDLVCVQLPRDATPVVPALRQVTRLPVAIFGHDAASGAHAWLPLSESSPELAAVRGAPGRLALVDVPLEHAVDPAPAWPRLVATVARLGRGPAELVERLCDELGAAVGATLGELAGDHAPTARERAIATAIRTHARGRRRIVVVAGAAHAAAIAELLDERGAAEPPPSGWRIDPGAPRRRLLRSALQIDLVPYDDRRLHATGAQRFPRWSRLADDADRGRVVARIAALVGRAARTAGIAIGPGDEAEAVALAGALAGLRGSARPALTDVLDAIRIVMVADRAGTDDELSPDGGFGPLGPILARVLVGGRRGAVPPGTAAVPLVADYRAAIAAVELGDGAARLDIYRVNRDLRRSQLLHQLRVLDVPGVDWVAGPDPGGDGGAQLVFERWRLALGAAADDALTELAALGATVREVATRIVHGRLDDPGCTIGGAVAAALDARRMGLEPIAIAAVVARPGRLAELGEALARLAGDGGLGTLAAALAARAIAALGQQTADPPDDDVVRWLDAVHAIYVHAVAHGARDELVHALEGVRTRAGCPVLLGAATALLHELGRIDPAAVVGTARMQCFAALTVPAALGRFVIGVALVAPGALARIPGLARALDAGFAACEPDAFLAMVPELRLAFSTMPPHAIARLVGELDGAPSPRAPHPADAAIATRLGALELVAGEPIPSHRSARRGATVTHAAPPLAARGRWRMVLGELAAGLGPPASEPDRRRIAVLDQLDRLERARTEREVAPGRSTGSRLGPPDLDRAAAALAWIAETRRYFPAEVASRLHDQAIHRYEHRELLLDPAVLRGLEPSPALATAVLALRGAASPEVVAEIRRIVAAVVRRIRHLFEDRLRPILAGARRIRDPDAPRTAVNFDLARTLRRNLPRYDPAARRLVGLDPVFGSRQRRRSTWRLILLVDRSGSMASSVIDTAVLAGVFAAVPALRVHLVLFDTEVADLTAQLDDPVELLVASSPQGGTDLRRPLAHAATLISAPRRTLVVLLSDLFHGGPHAEVVAAARQLTEAGVELLALTALSDRGADHDARLAHRLREVGAEVDALAPDALARWLATRLRR